MRAGTTKDSAPPTSLRRPDTTVAERKTVRASASSEKKRADDRFDGPLPSRESGWIELAQAIADGKEPFQGRPLAEREFAFAKLAALLQRTDREKPTRRHVLEQSAAATALLELAQAAPAGLRQSALTEYARAMAAEKSFPLRMSMIVNLDHSKLEIPASSRASAEAVRAQLLPPSPPYDEWFKGARPTLNVRHYVMSDFFRANVSAYKKRGFTVVEETPDRVVFTKTLSDPKAGQRPIEARAEVLKQDERIFRDMNDPKVQMVIYSGHAQLGDIVESALPKAPRAMKGKKLVVLYSCRGKQTAGDILERWPGVHLATTFSSAYDTDDTQMLTKLYQALGKRQGYEDLYRDLRGLRLDGGRRNYILPNDPRIIFSRDEDKDGHPDLSPAGPDRFYDPGDYAARGQEIDFRPRALGRNPEEIDGEKVDRAIGYARTSFYYFAEESHAAPIDKADADRLIPNGWVKSSSDAPVLITPVVRSGVTYYEVALNSRYANQNVDALTAMTLRELFKHFAIAKNGKYTEQDQLRTALLVGEYVSLYVPYSDDCDKLLQGFGRKYGFTGLSWDVIDGAQKIDGDEKLGTPAALRYLRRHGVIPPGPAILSRARR